MNLLDVVWQRAQSAPDAVAVVAPDGSATYRQLLARAAALAEAYEARGVGPGDRVGVVMAPGRDAVSAALAAFFLRAAYVPLDPTQPAARAVGILERCAPRLCVGFPAPGWEAAGLQSPESLAGPWPDGPDEVALTRPEAGAADDVAYVIHTSGSTGVSKGIEIEHLGVHNLILDMDDRAPVADPVVGSWWCSPDFDVSVWESWSVLARGGTLVIPSAADRSEAERFAAFLDDQRVTSAYVPHGYLAALLCRFREHPGSCRTMRRLVVGIEPIALGLLQDLLHERPELTVVNGYGPAEATVLCSLYVVPRTGGDRSDRTQIGTATVGNVLTLVDEEGRPTEEEIGELVISGDGVGRGYLNGTDEQLARFQSAEGTRSYRTGDRVKRLPDGGLLFLGRVDFQMKVRGYRIEPGEVETAIRASGTVREVVVGQRAVPGVGDAVVAYVVPARGTDFDANRVRAALRDVLPVYALPSAFVVVEEIPMTAKNGKVDRKALAALPLPAQAAQAAQAAPSAKPVPAAATASSQVFLDMVVGCWQRELHEPVSPDLGFVDHGGSSLPALRVAHTLREVTGRDVSAADVMAATSPADLAAKLAAARRESGDGPQARGSRRGPLSPNQIGLWLQDQIGGGGRQYLLPHCFVLPADYDLDRLTGALDRAAAAHPVFGATTRQVADGVDLLLDQHEVRLRVVDVEPDAGPERRLALVERELDEPFVLEGGALTRFLLVRDPARPDLLLVAWHHLIVDGWSVRLFLEDVRRCYADPDCSPAASKLTACDVNDWLVERAKTAQIVGRVEQIAADLAAVPDLDPLRSGTGGDQAVMRPVRLESGLTHQLLAAARRTGLRPFSFLSTAYQHALLKVVGVDRFVLGCVVAGRDRPELGRVAGWYVNTELAVATAAAPGLATVRAVEAGHDRVHTEQGDLAIADLAYRLRAADRKAPQVILSVDEEYTLRLDGTACEKIPLIRPRGILEANMVLLTGPDRIHGYFEHKPGFLSAEEATAVLEGFFEALGALAATGSDVP